MYVLTDLLVMSLYKCCYAFKIVPKIFMNQHAMYKIDRTILKRLNKRPQPSVTEGRIDARTDRLFK